MNKINLLKSRSFDRNMNISIEFLKQNYFPILKSLLIFIPFFMIPAYFLAKFQGNGMAAFTSGIAEYGIGNEFDFFNFSIGYFFLIVITLIASFFMISYMVVYSQSPDSKVDTDLVWEKVKNTSLPLLGASFLYGIAIILGIFLFIVPGIFIAVSWYFFTYVYIAEGKSVFDSFARSYQLVKNNWWKIFGFLLVVYLVGSVISAMLGLPVSMFMVLDPILKLGLIENEKFLAFSSFFTLIASFISLPICYAPMGVMYYSRRADADKTDVDDQIEHLGTSEEEE